MLVCDVPTGDAVGYASGRAKKSAAELLQEIFMILCPFHSLRVAVLSELNNSIQIEGKLFGGL
jgi:hypothetical protein